MCLLMLAVLALAIVIVLALIPLYLPDKNLDTSNSISAGKILLDKKIEPMLPTA